MRRWRNSPDHGNISDSAGAQEIVSARWPWLKHLFGDGAYDRTKLLNAAALRDFTVEIIRRSDDVSGFKVLPWRGSSSRPSAG